MKPRAWAEAIVFLFAWGFAMHASGLLLHELGGHALAASIFGCGISGYDLTFFGHGQVFYERCERWTFATGMIADWAGLGVTIAAGALAWIGARRTRDPLTRLLAALVAYFFLLGQLGYMTSGGFHDLYDPGRAARLLGRRGLHFLAWIPPLVAYALVATAGARAVVDAYRAHFGARRRLLALGAAGLLYFVAFRIEWQLRVDMTMKGVAAEATRVAIAKGGPPPFPIEHVLTAIAIGGVVLALRGRRPGAESRPLTRRHISFVVGAATTCLAVLALLMAASTRP